MVDQKINVRITALGEDVIVWCPYCNFETKKGNKSIIISYMRDEKLYTFYLGETIWTPCCGEELQAPMLFDDHFSHFSTLEKVTAYLEHKTLEEFKRSHILKRVPRKIRNFFRKNAKPYEASFEEHLNEEFKKTFPPNPLDFRNFIHDSHGNVFH